MWRNAGGMNSFFKAAFSIPLLFSLAVPVFSQDTPSAGGEIKKRLAILPVNNKTEFAGAGDVVADRLYSIFARRGGYRLLERAHIRRVLDEIDFSHSGYVKEDQAIEIGQLSGAEVVVLANVNSVTLSEHVSDDGTLFTSSASVGVRVLDLKTGTVLGSYDASESTFWPSVSAPKALRKAVEKAMEKLGDKILGEVQHEAVVLTYQDKVGTVDKGLDDGLRRKQKVLLVRDVEIKHPVTGEKVITREIIGEGKVEAATATTARVKLKVKKEGLDKYDVRPGDRIVWQPEVDD